MSEPGERAIDGFRVLTWIGIIEQLSRTRAERALKEIGLSFAEFSLLTHFSHGHPPEKTVTGIAADMQQAQPNVTKVVQRLVRKGFLRAAPNAEDGRSKLLAMTARGAQAQARAVARLAPAIEAGFEGWGAGEMGDLFRLLDRLKRRLDASR